MEIHWHNVHELGEKAQDAAEDRLLSLAAKHGDLINVRISGHNIGHHRSGGREIRIVCQARGHDIVATRAGSELSLALHDAIDAFEREIWRMRDRRNDHRGPSIRHGGIPTEPPSDS